MARLLVAVYRAKAEFLADLAAHRHVLRVPLFFLAERRRVPLDRKSVV